MPRKAAKPTNPKPLTVTQQVTESRRYWLTQYEDGRIHLFGERVGSNAGPVSILAIKGDVIEGGDCDELRRVMAVTLRNQPKPDACD